MTRAFPASVVMMVPLTMMFLRTKCLFAWLSTTVFIGVLMYFFALGSKMFANSATRTFIFLELPFVLIVLTWAFPTLVSVAALPISYFRLPRAVMYLPPVGFRFILARCITTMGVVSIEGVYKRCGNVYMVPVLSSGYEVVGIFLIGKPVGFCYGCF